MAPTHCFDSLPPTRLSRPIPISVGGEPLGRELEEVPGVCRSSLSGVDIPGAGSAGAQRAVIGFPEVDQGSHLWLRLFRVPDKPCVLVFRDFEELGD